MSGVMILPSRERVKCSGPAAMGSADPSDLRHRVEADGLENLGPRRPLRLHGLQQSASERAPGAGASRTVAPRDEARAGADPALAPGDGAGLERGGVSRALQAQVPIRWLDVPFGTRVG